MTQKKKILIGIGNELKGDDGIGNAIAREFAEVGCKDWLSLACETVPENFAGIVEKEKPELLVMIDAAEMGLPAGEIRLLPKKSLGSTVFGTHGMPLKHLVARLEKNAEKVLFIAVQPGKMQLGEKISADAEKSKKKIIGILKKKNWGAIKELE